MAKKPTGTDSGYLPQVHALNSLKDIFTDARFRLCIEIYVADGLEIAAACLESHVYNPFWFCRDTRLCLTRYQMEHT